MIIDKALQVSSAQVVTATAASTDLINFGQANPDIGLSGMSMVVTVSEAAAAVGAATVTIAVQDCATSDGTYLDVAVTPAIAKESLTLGAQVVIPMPPKLRRFCRLNYTVATGPLTAGKFSAQVVAGFQQNTPKPDSPRIA